MNDWVVESPSFEEQLMNNRIVYLNQKGINEVVELIKNKDKEIEKLNIDYSQANDIIVEQSNEIDRLKKQSNNYAKRIIKAIEYIDKSLYQWTEFKKIKDILEGSEDNGKN